MVYHFYGQITFMSKNFYGPEIGFVTWAKFSDMVAYVNLAIRLYHLHKLGICPPDNVRCINLKVGTSCNGYQFGN